MKRLVSFSYVAVFWLAGCQSDPTAGGGSPGTGGAAPASGSGGASATGGQTAPGSGGSATGGNGSAVSTGGSAASSGGATGTGGAVGASGGTSGTGGGVAAGGSGGTASGVDGGGATDAGATGGSMSVDPGTDGDGDFMAGPTYTKQSDLTSKGAQAGKSFRFTMQSANSIYTGMDSTLLSANQHSFTRNVEVYIPAKYQDGTAAPFLILHDGPDSLGNVKLALDNLTQSTDATRKLPAFVAISVANGGGDSKGSERGLEYDTMSDRYARFIETEVLPAVLANTAIKAAYPKFALTSDPDGRATIGCSSGGAAAMAMGWFRPDLYHRIITYSGTFVDQQDDDAAEEKAYPLGAWEYHSSLSLIANNPNKPLRVFINANETDNGYSAAESGHHNWLLANQRMASAFKAKKYHYRYVYGKSAGHCDGKVRDATLADTLLWVWRGYPL